MTTSEDLISSNTAMSEHFPLRKLPLELRREIYFHHLLITRHPSPKVIYRKKVPLSPRDPPSALLLVNRQVRSEVLDLHLVQRLPILLRVTHQGTQFSSLAETCFIAQQCSRDYDGIPHLVVDIWPPHPDRPTDAIDIWRHLRKLRAELIAVPQLQKISFLFRNNKVASWTHNGKALNHLESGSYEKGHNDIIWIMDLFSRIRATSARRHLPDGLEPSDITDSIVTQLDYVAGGIMGYWPIDEDAYSEEDKEQAEFQDWLDEGTESRLQRKGAEIARNKLDEMTQKGNRRLTRAEWDDFIDQWWPHFETLLPKDFKEKPHYVYEDDPWNSVGFLPVEASERDDSPFLKFSSFLNAEFRPFGDGMYEMVMVRDRRVKAIRGIFFTFPDLQEYSTKDLFVKHPTKEGWWRPCGRTDDMVVFTDGRKLNTTLMESVIESHPFVRSAILCGHARPRPALLVEPLSYPTTEEGTERLMSEIWVAAERAMQQGPVSGKLDRDLILVTVPNKPLLRAGGKGTIQRKRSLVEYQDEIDQLYDAFAKKTAEGSK